MSIFDRTSGFDPTDWMREKSLAALEIAVKLVDLANEPDTTTWYEKNLKRMAEHLIARLLPMTALLHGTEAKAVELDQWKGIVEKGTFALTKWCRQWKVANPYHFSESVTASKRDGDETTEKRQAVEPTILTNDYEHSLTLELEIHHHMAYQMLYGGLNDPAKSLLAWALFNLGASEYTDIAVLNKNFLPTDIGCTPEQTSEGYRLLYQKGLIEKVEGLNIIDEAIALRLVVEGINDSKHALPFQEVAFGRPGLRIQGKPTVGNIVQLTFDKHHNKYLEWMACSQEKIRQLHEALQQSIGSDYVYIENVQVVTTADKTDNKCILEIQYRHPFDKDDRLMEDQIKTAAEKWIKASVVSTTRPNG
ncbi:hypothetical protein [Desulfosarcina ovata]|uniref:Uncharacterized protein n=1 Tax=Desulfosarcina ovata subsp. ovata TaxID=2752305 RepID=A0A5K8A3H8_9BACT|nr:hypothetical protein [Desulfosarcina ovata]BBO87133.1 hypothetical protein DSCOOX_03130 [Desulfosarcina ovata subsp. ovata]